MIRAGAARWGNTGSNGGRLMLTAAGQTMNGSIEADNISSATIKLEAKSLLSGSINVANTAQRSSELISDQDR